MASGARASSPSVGSTADGGTAVQSSPGQEPMSEPRPEEGPQLLDCTLGVGMTNRRKRPPFSNDDQKRNQILNANKLQQL